jgi:hypothetical protein
MKGMAYSSLQGRPRTQRIRFGSYRHARKQFYYASPLRQAYQAEQIEQPYPDFWLTAQSLPLLEQPGGGAA